MTAPQPDQIGAYLGMALGTCSFAGLTGTPITGALVSRFGFHPAFIFGGVSTLLGGVFVYCAKVFHTGASLIGW